MSRNECQSLSIFLTNKGHKAKPYPSGLPAPKLTETFDNWKRNSRSIIGATVCCGLDIDNSFYSAIINGKNRVDAGGANNLRLVPYSTIIWTLMGCWISRNWTRNTQYRRRISDTNIYHCSSCLRSAKTRQTVADAFQMNFSLAMRQLNVIENLHTALCDNCERSSSTDAFVDRDCTDDAKRIIEAVCNINMQNMQRISYWHLKGQTHYRLHREIHGINFLVRINPNSRIRESKWF